MQHHRSNFWKMGRSTSSTCLTQRTFVIKSCSRQSRRFTTKLQVHQVRDSKLSEEGVIDRPLGTDRLTSLPIELQIHIVKYLIPNRGRIAVGFDHYGPNTSGIQPGSLNISRVSKHFSKTSLQVLYGHRWFRISASCRDDDQSDVMLTVSVSKTCPVSTDAFRTTCSGPDGRLCGTTSTRLTLFTCLSSALNCSCFTLQRTNI